MDGNVIGKWPAIGVDLGTTNSCVGVWQPENDRVEIIANDLGSRTTPSCVAFTNTKRLIGESAKNQAADNPSNTIFDAKRLIGRRFTDPTVQNDMKLWPFKVIEGSNTDNGGKPMIVVTYKGEEKQFSAEEISSMVLVKMKETAEAFLGTEVNNAVITVPAYFNDSQRSSTKDAAVIAGLHVLHIINETTAAAIAYCLDKKVEIADIAAKTVMVFDLGGGTFDVSLVTIQNDVFEVKAVSGNAHLGGRDFDNRMVSHFVAEFSRNHGKDISGNPRALGRLRAACERAKRNLSSTTETAIEIDCLFEGIDFTSTISRAQFEKLNLDLFKQCMELVEKCLKDAKMESTDIHDVVIIGGSTRIPKVQQLLQEFFNGKNLCKNVNADEAVAYGAALHAAILTKAYNNNSNMHVLIKDVTPLSLGIELHNGAMSIIVPRNSPIPTRRVQRFTTFHDNQLSVPFAVYEGEKCLAKDNRLLGKFTLSDIPSALRGVPNFDVCFDIDANGILTVCGELLGTNNKKQITITSHSGRFEKVEIDRMKNETKMFETEVEELEKTSKAKNSLENYLHFLSGVLAGCGKNLGFSDKLKLGDEIGKTNQWIEWNYLLVDASKFEEKMKEVKSISEPIIAKIDRPTGR